MVNIKSQETQTKMSNSAIIKLCYQLVVFNAKGARHLEMMSVRANCEPLGLNPGYTFTRLKTSPRDCDVIDRCVIWVLGYL